MNVNWRNPYEAVKEPFKLKGNLHTHTEHSGCGKLPLTEILQIYEKMNYAFIAITDHDIKTDISMLKSASLTVLPGIEIDIKGAKHFGVVNCDSEALYYDANATQQEMINRNVEAGGIVVLNHPDWQLREHYTIDELMELKNYTGIEIYNSVIEFLGGASLSTAKWDRLLAAGRRVLGFANQDFHDSPHALDCCNVISGNDQSPKRIIAELLAGRFYCHYGVRINALGRNGDRVFVETDNAKLIRFIGAGGILLKKAKSNSAEISFSNSAECDYIRIECLGEGEEISFSQPFFRG
jgi:hypothetical protein